MINQSETLMLIGMLLGYPLFRVLELAITKLRRRGKVRAMLIDPDSGLASLKWIAPNRGNEFTHRERQYILEGHARLSEGSSVFKDAGPLWLIHARHGWNFVFPTDGETVRIDRNLATASISDPESYRKAIMLNEARDALEANEDSGAWIVKVAPLALIALLVVTVGVIFIAYRLLNGVPAPGA